MNGEAGPYIQLPKYITCHLKGFSTLLATIQLENASVIEKKKKKKNVQKFKIRSIIMTVMFYINIPLAYMFIINVYLFYFI